MIGKRLNSKFLSVVALFILIALLFPDSISHAAKTKELIVEGVRYRSGPRYTRIVVDLSGGAEFTHHLLKKDMSSNKPERLMIDIKGAKLNKAIDKKFSINDSLLASARVGQYDAATVRVVLDIVSIAEYKVFLLPNPYRIVIDVMGTGYKYATPQVVASPAVKPEAPAQTKPEVTVPTKIETPVQAKPSAEAGTAKPTAIKTPTVEVPVPVSKPEPEPTPTSTPTPTPQYSIKTIVIDAGHGGKDPGAVGKKKTREKDITLKLAKYVKSNLQKKVKSKILLTRDTDVFIPLDERTAIANAKEADLFVSIHVNASFNRSARGVETYYLKLDGLNKEELEIAARENATSTEEMGDTLKFILKDLAVTGNRDESIRLASIMQETLSGKLRSEYKDVKSNGIKGAPFYVLVHTAMPSILVEVSYISNSVDEKRLKTDEYLRILAAGIADAVEKYVNGAKPS